MTNIISIKAEGGTEPCNVEVDALHDLLLQLPAKKYLELYRMMKDRVENENPSHKAY